jgi:hypothetical protein
MLEQEFYEQFIAQGMDPESANYQAREWAEEMDPEREWGSDGATS